MILWGWGYRGVLWGWGYRVTPWGRGYRVTPLQPTSAEGIPAQGISKGRLCCHLGDSIPRAFPSRPFLTPFTPVLTFPLTFPLSVHFFLMPSVPQFPQRQDEKGSAAVGGEGMEPLPMGLNSPRRNAPTPAATPTTARSRRGPSVPTATAATAARWDPPLPTPCPPPAHPEPMG